MKIEPIEAHYRGKAKDNGEWLYGSLLYNPRLNRAFILPTALWPVDDYAVDPQSVGMFTGRIDKTGESIFCGDIIRNDFGNIGLVYWNKNRLALCVDYGKLGITSLANENIDSKGLLKAQVLGNIHDPNNLWKEPENE